MTEEKNLSAVGQEILLSARSELYMSMPYLFEALCALAITPGDDTTVTAATNGRELYYNGNFTANTYIRNASAMNRLYLHTVLHCMLRHIWKKRGHDSELWDLSCDAVVESIIDSLPHACVRGYDTPARQKFYGQCRSEMKVLTAEGIYRMLLRDRRTPYEIAQLQRLFLQDDHGLWDMEKKDDSQEQQDEQWKDIASRTQTAMETVLSNEAHGGEAVLEQVRISARDDVDYRTFLRRFAAPREIIQCDNDAFDYIFYTYGLRHYGNMPLIEPPETREEKRIEDFVIAVDTSMSTSGELVREFLRCTYAILRSMDTFTNKLNIHIIQCDDTLRSDIVIRDMKELQKYMESFRLIGGSATDFRPVFEHVEELQKAGAFTSLRGLIYFTDGMGIYPTKRPPYDVAFVLLEEPPLEIKMPPWCIKLMLTMPDIEKASAAEEVWQEETIAELPEL